MSEELEARTVFDAATGAMYEIHVKKGAPPLPGQSVRTLLDASLTFAEALEAALPGKPVQCPCCGHAHRTYRRKLNSGMAKVLISLYRLGNGKEAAWVNVSELFKSGPQSGGRPAAAGEWALLRHWGLVLPRERRTATKNSVGDWRLSPLGVVFCENLIEVPRYIEVRNGVCLNKSEETTSILGALGNGFSYLELMQGGGAG